MAQVVFTKESLPAWQERAEAATAMPAGWEKAGLVGLQEGGTQIDVVTLGLVGESK